MPKPSLQETAVTHSPGPWLFEAIPPVAHADPDMQIGEDSLFWIAEARTAGHVIATVVRVGESTEANARLMAAAPKMLQALHEVVGAHTEAGNCFYCLADSGEPHEDDCTMSFVNEAIAKAEGAR